MPSPEPPVLDWQDGQPRSRRFGDIYYSRLGGIAEATHVFLEGNALTQRWAALKPGQRFVVGEIGFGTGLNFLSAWQHFERTAAPGAQLHFVSCEFDPLSPAELRQALDIWPQLSPQRDALIRQYRALSPGWHRFAFIGHAVHLTLLIGDPRACLPRLSGKVDAWFFDGFSPAKNPEAWSAELFRAAALVSAPGATLATYSVAGSVRRAAQEAGFNVHKAPGFGSKRQMLSGRLRAGAGAVAAPAASTQTHPARTAAVIGAGMAGCAAAFSLARRGWKVCLIERRERIASEASGNPQGVLYARLRPSQSALGSLVLAGYQYTLRLLREILPCDGEQWSDAPVLQFAAGAREAKRQAALLEQGLPQTLVRAVDAAQAAAIAGVAVARPALLFEGGGWVHPPALCAALAATPGIELSAGCEIDALRFADGRWRLTARSRTVSESEVVVLAVAGRARAFPATSHLPLRANRGQITQLPQTAASSMLRAVLCGERYVAPARKGRHTTGATFAREDDDAVRAADNAQNVEMLDAIAPGLRAAFDLDLGTAGHLEGRAGLRCVSPDYLPVIGAVGGAAHRSACGLYASLAHGSRGLITAPLAGEMLAACIDGEPAPLPRELMAAVSGSRFAAPPDIAAVECRR